MQVYRIENNSSEEEQIKEEAKGMLLDEDESSLENEQDLEEYLYGSE